ncbi:hypothetical protein [Paenibacillus sp. MMS18-CY102]|uniref:hypothetical protein n=1 Tax=Paenibacillus sp. MMS18-CY102 TaxID=2682849 RepID=UPI00136662B8|nr:hypothetical protein [Paenibacillus sp. MMS18-CY102]MWC29750.1 hypothetical protein [Paenibacillus sp. MMS18-CY102]
MKRIKKIVAISLFFLLSGCFNQNHSEVVSENEVSVAGGINNSGEAILSYSQYKDLTDRFQSNLIIPEFTLKAESGKNIVIVEKDLTFEKRENLTLDGSRDFANVQPTSYIFIFENQAQSKQIIVRVSFNKNYIGNDLLDWSRLNNYANINEKLASQFDMATLSYKNLIVTVQQLADREANLETTKTAMRAIIKELVEF